MHHRTLIVGATGRVGVELTRLLLERGEAVRAAARNPSSTSARLPRGAEDRKSVV
jgi:uncharacterized protein YbjT (DUF2867 family)